MMTVRRAFEVETRRVGGRWIAVVPQIDGVRGEAATRGAAIRAAKVAAFDRLAVAELEGLVMVHWARPAVMRLPAQPPWPAREDTTGGYPT